MSLIGRQLDEYRIDQLLGQGGMARVYLALDVRLNRQVAIKVIDAPLDLDSAYTQRFEREAQAVARLEHPHIVRLYRYGEIDGLPYMVMQYIPGSNLRALLATYRKAGKAIEPREASRIVAEVCAALDFAHQRGVIHRDVKPSNILLDRQGRVFLADFGLARLADVRTLGEIFGSPYYMAPEQAISSAATVSQTDLYALGVILYEMFTGRVPFDAESATEVAMLHVSEEPRPPGEWGQRITPDLEAVILTALAKEPADRYASGAALADDLEQALQVTYARSPSQFRTMVSRSAMEADLPPLPPPPAAAIVGPDAVQTDLSGTMPAAQHDPPPAASPSRRGKGWRWLALLVIFLGIGGALAAQMGVLSQGDDAPTVASPAATLTVDPVRDPDGDGVLVEADLCPEQPGLPETGGCLYTGTIFSTTYANVNLRTGPGTGYRVVESVQPGTDVTLLGRTGPANWIYVQAVLDDGEQVPAWVLADLLETDTDLKILPIAGD
jgi:serine/threonine protein kinase